MRVKKVRGYWEGQENKILNLGNRNKIKDQSREIFGKEEFIGFGDCLCKERGRKKNQMNEGKSLSLYEKDGERSSVFIIVGLGRVI